MDDHTPERSPRPFALILAVTLLQLAVLEIGPPPWIQQSANLVLTPVFAWCVWTLAGSRAVGAVVLLSGWLPALMELAVPYGEVFALDRAKDALWILFPLTVAGVLGQRLLTERDVRHHELWAAVALYLLIGVGFANLHETIGAIRPGSYLFPPMGQTAPSFSDYLYFSFVTLSTVGYGDVAPLGRGARLAALIEALVGLLYIAVVVGRVVALHTARRSGQEQR
jgi:hypothetical protein